VFWYSADKIDLLGANLRDFILTRLGLQHYDLERFEAQRKFVDILSFTNAFFGIGPSNYELYSRIATHSLYARYIGERGLFGVSLFALFWALVLREVSNPRDKNFILLVLLGQLVNSVFIDSLHWRHLWLLITLAFLG
jgi:hypothetical protein